MYYGQSELCLIDLSGAQSAFGSACGCMARAETYGSALPATKCLHSATKGGVAGIFTENSRAHQRSWGKLSPVATDNVTAGRRGKDSGWFRCSEQSSVRRNHRKLRYQLYERDRI